ncbi:MAG: antitoxin Xre/MbcA/ParS toxin-binding domain-containing protein [Parvibaculaceae bacterium]
MSIARKAGEKTGKLRVPRASTSGEFLYARKSNPRLMREQFAAPEHAPDRTHPHASSILERVERQRRGVPAEEAVRLQRRLGVSALLFQTALGIPAATFKNKIRAKAPFTGSAGYAISELEELIEIAEKLLPPEDRGKVDVHRWFGDWIQVPQPGLAGRAPKDILDQPAGRKAVKRVLGALASGSYI